MKYCLMKEKIFKKNMKINLLIILLIIYIIIYNKNSIYFKRKNINKNSTEILFNIANITENITTENATNEITTNIKENKKRIGVIGADHGQNIGNNLLKYAMFIKLKEFGFDPYIVGYLRPGNNISFLEKIINIKYINKFFIYKIKKI